MAPMLPIGPWLPDQAPIDHPGLLTATNIIPIAGGYGPFPSLSSFSGSLSSYCRGAISGRDKTGVTYSCAGDATKLYLRKTGLLVNVSKAGGYHNTATNGWEIIQLGNVLFAVNYDDQIQTFDLGTSALFADMGVATAPRARHIALVRDFLVAGYCYDPNGGPVGLVPNRVWWSGRGKPTTWPLYGTPTAILEQSDYQDLDGGEIQHVIAMAEIGLIVMDRAVWRMDYVGGETFFNFSPITREEGSLVSGSVVTRGKRTVFWSEDGWKMTDGVEVRSIGDERIDRTFAAKFDIANRHRMIGVSHPRRKLMMWIYPGTGNVGGLPNRALFYQYELNQWSEGEFDCEFLVQALPPATSMDDYPPPNNLDTPDAPFTTGSLDDGAFMGFPWDLGGFSSQHSLGIFNGPNLSATLETGDRQIYPGRRATVRKVRVVGDTNQILFQMAARANQYDAVAYGDLSYPDSNGELGLRSNGRYHRAKMFAANFTTLQGFDVEVQIEGSR